MGGDFNEPSHRDWVEANKNLYDHNGMVIPWTVTTLLEDAGFIDSYREIYLTHSPIPGFTYPSDNPLKTPEKLTWAPKADERDRMISSFIKGKAFKQKRRLYSALKVLSYGAKE